MGHVPPVAVAVLAKQFLAKKVINSCQEGGGVQKAKVLS
jgi:hypothetical protein